MSLCRFPGSSGAWRTASLVCGGILGGKDPRWAPLLRPGAISGHLLWPTSGHWLLLGPARLRQQESTGANGSGQDRLRHPAEPANPTACGCITGVAIPYSSSQPHWTTPTRVRCWCIKYSPGFPSRPSTSRRREAYSGPTTTSSASSRGQASPCRSVFEGLGAVLHQAVHQQLPLLAGGHIQ